MITFVGARKTHSEQVRSVGFTLIIDVCTIWISDPTKGMLIKLNVSDVDENFHVEYTLSLT